MIIFGKDERAKFEDIRDTLSDVVCRQYDEAKTYHDGKWVMFEPTNADEFDDYMKLLAIKENQIENSTSHHHRANLTRTFKTEYQPLTGGTTEQEILKQVPCSFFCPDAGRKEDITCHARTLM